MVALATQQTIDEYLSGCESKDETCRLVDAYISKDETCRLVYAYIHNWTEDSQDDTFDEALFLANGGQEAQAANFLIANITQHLDNSPRLDCTQMYESPNGQEVWKIFDSETKQVSYAIAQAWGGDWSTAEVFAEKAIDDLYTRAINENAEYTYIFVVCKYWRSRFEKTHLINTLIAMAKTKLMSDNVELDLAEFEVTVEYGDDAHDEDAGFFIMMRAPTAIK